jgi:hypothetical protein
LKYSAERATFKFNRKTSEPLLMDRQQASGIASLRIQELATFRKRRNTNQQSVH